MVCVLVFWNGTLPFGMGENLNTWKHTCVSLVWKCVCVIIRTSLCLTLNVIVLCDPDNSCVQHWVTGLIFFFLKPTECIWSFTALTRYRALCASFCACEELQLGVSFSVRHHCQFSLLSIENNSATAQQEQKGLTFWNTAGFSHCVATDNATLITKRTVSEKPTISAQYSLPAQKILFTVSSTTHKEKKKNNKENH